MSLKVTLTGGPFDGETVTVSEQVYGDGLLLMQAQSKEQPDFKRSGYAEPVATSVPFEMHRYVRRNRANSRGNRLEPIWQHEQ